ncbi:MAG TPA: amidohydrolase family protein [Pseudonocardiaceae bacterium]|nr:amidohydrolase family protein [Pseudonocardiaceae bacterium]
MTDVDLRIAGGRVFLPGGTLSDVDVLVRGGVVTGLVSRDFATPGAETLDAGSAWVLPGAIDAHVHLGKDITVPTDPDDASLESHAAALGGVTTILGYLMTPRPYTEVFDPAREIMANSIVDYGFHFCLVTPDQITQIPVYTKEFGVSSFKFFMNFRGEEGSYLGLPGNDDGFLYDVLRAVAENGAMANPHAENIEIVWRLRREGIDTTAAPLRQWYDTRPPFVEAEAEQRVAYLARTVGASMYAVHVTCAEALTVLLRERERYQNIFVETCPHYLTHDVSSPVGMLGKVNPPLREHADREALWAALASGQVDVIGSDHVPRHVSRKAPDIWKATAGFPGLQTLLPVTVDGAVRRGIPLGAVVRATAERPAQIFGLYPRKGVIAVGSDADIAVVDPQAAQTITREQQASGGGYSIWEGHELGCTVRHTISRGTVVVRDGQLTGAGSGQYLARPVSGAAALEAAGVDR